MELPRYRRRVSSEAMRAPAHGPGRRLQGPPRLQSRRGRQLRRAIRSALGGAMHAIPRSGIVVAAVLLMGVAAARADQAPGRSTEVSIRGDSFLIGGKPTYAGRTWRGHSIEGLLLNTRMVQGIFDD